MAAFTTWVANFHGANADPAASAYEQELLTTVASYSGYATKSIFITEPHHDWQFSGEAVEDIGGWETKHMTVRQVFDNMLTYPFHYRTGVGDQDMADWAALVAVLKKSYLWVSVWGGSEKWPSDILYVHPVNVEISEPAINTKNGTRTYTITARLKGLS